MNSKAKIAPLFFILLLTLSVTAYAPTARASSTTATSQQMQAEYSPSSSAWVNNSAAYADYNGHLSQQASQYAVLETNQSNYIMTADLNVSTLAPRYANLSISVYNLFTGAVISQIQGVWYNISTQTGLVAHTGGFDNSTLHNSPSFLYVPQVAHLNFGQQINISTPFNQTALEFTLIKFETVLGIQTKLLATSWNSTYYSGSSVWSSSGEIDLWISNDSNGLLMRMSGWDQNSYTNYPYYQNNDMQMSVEIAQTNIVTLVPPTIPQSIVGWMSPGKYIRYNLQGSGYIDASIINHTSGVTWALPGNAEFRVTVSANLTMDITRGTTAWVDPWNETCYMWVVHVMLNNTQLLLPDLDRTIKYLNQTLGAEGADIPYPQTVTEIESMFSPFNHTGLVADTWFLVDNATGTMFWPGVNLQSVQPITGSSTTTELGNMLSEGFGLEILSYFAQSVLYQGWSISNPVSTQVISSTNTNSQYTETTSGTALVSITDMGTTYLNFLGGGGGTCWNLQPSANIKVTESTMLNRSAPSYPFSNAMNYLMQNGTIGLTSTGYIDVERTTGFPLAFNLQNTFTYDGTALAQPYFWMSTGITISVDLSAAIAKTNVWFSNPPVQLIAGFGGNATTPPGYFGQYGFDVWTNGAGNVTVTSSVSQPPETGAPPSGTLPFIYLDVAGIKLPNASQVILYVYFNRTKVLDLGLDENSLKIYVWNTTATAWSALQTTHLDLNSTVGVLLALLPHFSYFAVLGSPPVSGGGIPTTYLLIAAVAVILVLATVVVLKRRKGGVK
jgi:hypothetical protein